MGVIFAPVSCERALRFAVNSSLGFRECAHSVAPDLAKTSKMDLPIPRLEPVITAVLPFRSILNPRTFSIGECRCFFCCKLRQNWILTTDSVFFREYVIGQSRMKDGLLVEAHEFFNEICVFAGQAFIAMVSKV